MAEAARNPEHPTAEKAPDAVDSADDENPTRIGRYQVERKLGSGGMADAYLCRQTGMGGFDRQVVVKRIRSHLRDREDVIFMFLDEARIIAQLSHPNVVQIYDIDEQEGLPYLVMEYVRGMSFETLSRRLHQRGVEYPIDFVAALGEQACAGLHAAHDLRDGTGAPLGVVHRDVSPSNLLLSIDGVVKIIDFGVARAKNRLAVTSAGHLKGRAGYVAPEALTDTVIDRRADVFALGVVLYELCTGKTLFDHDTDVARLGAVLTQKAKPLNQVRGDAEIGMTEVLQLALEIDPRKRHESAAAFGAALHAVAMRSGRFVTPTQVGDWLEQHVPEDLRKLGRHLTPRTPQTSISSERTQSQPSPFSTTLAAPVAPSSLSTAAQPSTTMATAAPSSMSPVSSMATNLQLPLPNNVQPMIGELSAHVRSVAPVVNELAQQLRVVAPAVNDLAEQVRLMRRLYWPLVTLFWLFGLGLILLGVWMLLQSAHR